MLQQAGDVVAEARRAGEIDSVGAAALDRHLHGMAGIQAASERIGQTPLPFAYTLLAHRTAYVYCYLLPFGLVSGAGWFTPVFTAIVAYTFSPSISALGIRAATESMTITSTALERTSSSQMSRACSPVSGWADEQVVDVDAQLAGPRGVEGRARRR